MSVTLSKSIDLPNNHPPSLDQSVSAKHLTLTADRAEYAPLSSAYIKIPKLGYLHGNESFLSFSVKYTATLGTAAILNLDGCAYSLIRSVELTHGTETLVSQNDCGRAWVALRDFSSDGNSSDTIGLGADSTNKDRGHPITNNSTYNYAFCLPVSLVGSLSSGTATPLGWMGGGDLTLKITFNSFSDAVYIVSGTSATSATSFTVSDVVFNAKVSQLDNSVDMALRSAYGEDAPVVIPSQEISIQSGIAPASVGSVNQMVTLPYSSCKGVAWWLTNSSVTNGVVNNNRTGRALSTRTLGILKDTYIQIAGQQVPQGGIKAAKVGTNTGIAFNQGVVYGYVQQFMNSLASASPKCLVNISQFANGEDTLANITGVHNTSRGMCALDLDRSDVDQSQIYQGVNSANSQCSVVMNFNTPLAEAHNLYVMALYDCSFVMENGQMRRVV